MKNITPKISIAKCCLNCSKSKEGSDLVLLCSRFGRLVAKDNVCKFHNFKTLTIKK